MNRYEKLVDVLQRVQEEERGEVLMSTHDKVVKMLDSMPDLKPHEIGMCGAILNEVEMKLQEVAIAK